jgi:hypothetical protein
VERAKKLFGLNLSLRRVKVPPSHN